MPQVHIILVHADEQTYVDNVYQNLEDAKAELNNPAYGEWGSDEWHGRWADYAVISTFDIQ